MASGMTIMVEAMKIIIIEAYPQWPITHDHANETF